MTLQAIKYGAAANDGTGDSLREAMRKTQQNFEYLDQGKVDKVAGMGLSSNNYTNDERVKLANIQAAATKNLADAILLSRANHTGMQGMDTVEGLGDALDAALRVRLLSEPTILGFLDQMWHLGPGYYRNDSVNPETQLYGAGFFSRTADTWSFISVDRITGTPLFLSGIYADIEAGSQKKFLLGSAATRNVQVTALDTMPGNLMAVGAFGLGALNAASGVNLNNYSYFPTGVSFQYHNGAINGPYPEFYGYITVVKVDNLYLIQRAEVTTTGVTYRRTISNGVVSPWYLVTDTQSAVGTIATGSIFETGTNANGTYTKFADGTLICTYRKTFNQDLPAGAATAPSYSFAATFVGSPMLSMNAGFYSELNCTGDQIYAALYGYGSESTAGTLAVSILNTGNKPIYTHPTESIGTFAAKSYRVEATAIGRWK